MKQFNQDINMSIDLGFKPISTLKTPTSAQVSEESQESGIGFKPITTLSESNPEDGESFLGGFARKSAGVMARTLESFLGAPGEFAELADQLTKPIADFLIPVEKGKIPELANLPKTKELRQLTKKLTGDYLEPKGKVEEALHEGGELLGSILGPTKWRKALGLSIGSQMAKEGSKLLGASPTAQEATKFGTLLSLSLVNPKGVKNYWNNLYQQRDALISPGTYVDATKLEKNVSEVINQIKKGTVAPSEAKVLDQAEKILEKIQKGMVDLDEMTAVKRSLNEVAGDPDVWKRGKNLFGKLQKSVSDTLASNPNKEAVKLGKMADEAYGAFHESQKLSRGIKKIVGDKPLKSIILSAGVEALSGYPQAIIPTMAGASAVAGGVKGMELMYRINSSPVLRKYYLNTLINASMGNLRAAESSLRKLDEGLEKQEKKK